MLSRPWPVSDITYPTTYPIPETRIVAPPLPWMRAACVGKCLASCNPGRGSDCDTCPCRGCPYCLVLKKRPPRHEGHALPTIDDCGWLSSMHDLRTKDSSCFAMHNTSRRQCESFVTSTGHHGVEDGVQCASNVVTCVWHRCSERRDAPSNASQPVQAGASTPAALPPLRSQIVCCDFRGVTRQFGFRKSAAASAVSPSDACHPRRSPSRMHHRKLTAPLLITPMIL